MVSDVLDHAFYALSAITAVAWLTFWRLRAEDGESISRGIARDQTTPAVNQT